MRIPVLMLMAAIAGQAETAGELAARVRDALAGHRSDAEIAAEVRQAKLTDSLEDPMLEALEGLGPLTTAALEAQRDASALLPVSKWRMPEADTPPSAEEQARIVQQARTIAMQYTANLPNFLCTETVRRTTGKTGKETKPRDTLVLDVSFNGKADRYRLRSINGKQTTKSLYEVGGFRSSGDFGNLQKLVFDPASQTRFEWSGVVSLRGRRARVFAFAIDATHSGYGLDFRSFMKGAEMVAALKGMAYLDAETNRLLRLRIEAVGMPAKWPVKRTVSTLDYDFADVGGQQYLLPRTSDLRLYLKDGTERNVMEFSDYRRFAGEATISFDK
jgi:hypothetical protein